MIAKPTEKELRAFLDDLVAVCERHGMAICNQDDYGMAAVPWPTERFNPTICEIYNITPDGYVSYYDGANPFFSESHRL